MVDQKRFMTVYGVWTWFYTTVHYWKTSGRCQIFSVNVMAFS